MKNQKNIKVKFKHHMLREIFEQPDVIQKNIEEHIDLKKKKVIFNELVQRSDDFKEIERITFLGCGTSYHAALLGNYIFEELAGLPCEFEMADEFNRRDPVIEKNTSFVVISQSGETAEGIIAAKKVKRSGSHMIVVTNNGNSTLAKMASGLIINKAGTEKAVAATKTFTSQMILLILLAVFFCQIKCKKSSFLPYVVKEIIKLPVKIKTVLEKGKSIALLVKEFTTAKNIIFLGSTYSLPVALEGALKVKETSYIEAEGIAAGEFKHGPMALVNKNLSVIFINPLGRKFAGNKKIMLEIKNNGAKNIVVTDAPALDIKGIADYEINIPKTMEILSPLLTVIPLQLLAYYLSIAKGNNPDKPRNLKKFVGSN